MQGRDVPECTAGHHGLVHQNEKSTLGDISVNAGTADLLELWVFSVRIPVSINLFLPGHIYGLGHRVSHRGVLQGLYNSLLRGPTH